jgi:GDP-L-fucose synthase
MDTASRIFVAGHNGLVGSAIVRALRQRGYSNLLLRSHQELDLTDEKRVRELFLSKPPAYVFLAAAKVGGIHANATYPADFIRVNLRIQSNVVESAYSVGIRRLLFLGSSCIYPKFAPQPIPENALLTGELEPTNRAYALAKIAGIEMCSAFNRQYGTQYLAAMPCNIYGVGDYYHPDNSHVIPALILKMHAAKISGADHVTLWGTGTPRREFLFADDLAEACVFLMNLPDSQLGPLVNSADEPPLVNVGFGSDVTIFDLARLVANAVGFKGQIEFDNSKPDGTPRKLLDVSRLKSMGWHATTTLEEGLERTVQDFHRRSSAANSDLPGSAVPKASLQ